MSKAILFFVFLLVSSPANSLERTFSIDVQENEPVVVVAENIAFYGHATQFWNTSGSTERGVRTLVENAKKFEYTSVAMLYPHHLQIQKEVDQYYFTDDEVDFSVLSVAGQHRLKFPNAKNIFFVGGNLDKCLCESIRDAAVAIFRSEKFTEVNFFLVRDGIYADWPPFHNMTPASAKDFVKSFFNPAFNCPRQIWGGLPRIPMPGVAMEASYDGVPFGTYDLEPTDDIPVEKLTRKFKVHFITSDMVEGIMKEIERKSL